MAKILDYLFLGDSDAAWRFKNEPNDIIAVINCSEIGEVENEYEGDGIAYLNLDLDPMDEITGEIGEKIISFINNYKDNGSVLVHCAGGVQRSPSVVMVYLASIGYTLMEAYDHVVESAWEVRPEEPMIKSIRDLEFVRGKPSDDEIYELVFKEKKRKFWLGLP